MEAKVRWGWRPFSFLLARHPPSASLLGILGITDVKNDQDVRSIARHRRREIGIFPPGIAIPVRARGISRLPMRKQFWMNGVSDVPKENPLFRRFSRIGTPVSREIPNGRNHDVIMQFHLNGPCVRRAGKEVRYFWIRRVSHVNNTPATTPEVPHVQEPVITDVPNGHLEGAAPPVKIAIADWLHIAGFPACRYPVRPHTLSAHPQTYYHNE